MQSPRGSRPFARTPPVYPFHDRTLRNRFLDLVRRHLGRDGRRVEIRGGSATVEGNPFAHGLTNLAQVCHQNSTVLWPEIIAEHFEKSEPARVATQVRDAFGQDFEHSADRLGVRIYADDFVADGMAEHVVHRFDLPGTVTALILDIGGSVMPLPTPVAAQWGIDVDALFARAVRNLDTLCEARWQVAPSPLGDGESIDVFGDDFYCAASILRPEPFLPRIGRHGNLIAVPARDALLSWPIDTMPSMHPLEAMLAISHGKFRDGPGSITPDLFWRTPAGEFQRQQGTIAGGRARLAPSPEFADLIAQLHRRRPRGQGR